MNTTFCVIINEKKRSPEKSGNRGVRCISNIFILVLAVFITIAAMQAFALGNMLSEAKSIGNDIALMHTNQEVLRERYISSQ